MGDILIKLTPNEYIVIAHGAVTVRAPNTIKNLPKPPIGSSIATKKDPKSSPPLALRAVDQEGMAGAAAAKAAPIMWPMNADMKIPA